MSGNFRHLGKKCILAIGLCFFFPPCFFSPFLEMASLPASENCQYFLRRQKFDLLVLLLLLLLELGKSLSLSLGMERDGDWRVETGEKIWNSLESNSSQIRSI